MNKYKCFYNRKTWEVTADTLYAAKLAAIKLICPPRSKEHMISVVLCEKDGQTVEISTASI